jgi:hypothetical protein
MIDSTHLKAPRTASSLLKRGLFLRCIGRTKGGLNSKLHAVCNDQGRPLILALTEGQTSDYKGAALVFDYLPIPGLLSATRAMTQTGCARARRPRHCALYPTQDEQNRADPLRPNPLQGPPQDRDHVWAPQGLAARPYPLRSLRPHIHGRYRHSSHSYLMALIPKCLSGKILNRLSHL